MQVDQVLKAVGTAASLYLVALSVAAMTLASMGAAGLATASLCSGRDCGIAAEGQHHPLPSQTPKAPYHAVLIAPMLLLED